MRIDVVALAALIGASAIAQTSVQTSVPLEGVVVDRGGAAVVGATVTFFTRQAVRYQATTDTSGAFRIAAMEPGAYEAMIEKIGFVVFPKEPVIVGNGSNPARARFEMQFGTTRPAKLSGRVIDSQGKPAANAQIDLIVSPELWHRTIADANGRFAFDRLNPGAYELRAAPANVSTPDVATFFPSSIEESGAQRIVVRGVADIDGFQLRTASVFHVKGFARDDNGPAARVNVKLVPITEQPAHVISSFGAYFLAIGKSSIPGPDVAHTVTGDDGSFEFPSVPKGEWRVAAEAARASDPRTGFNLTPSGAATVIVVAGEVANVRVDLSPPFTLAGSSRWAVAQCHDPDPPRVAVTADGSQTPVVMCPVDGRTAPAGTVYPILLAAIDGQSSIVNAAVTQTDGTFVLQPVHAGRYLIKTLTALGNPAVTNGHADDYSRPGIRDSAIERGEPVNLARNSPPFELGGGVFDPDGTRPVKPALLAGPGEVQGLIENASVENGAGVAVVLVWGQLLQHPEDALGQLVFCQADGTFEARRLAPGTYYAAAFRGLDAEGLRAPELLERVADKGLKVQVKAGVVTEVRLSAESLDQ